MQCWKFRLSGPFVELATWTRRPYHGPARSSFNIPCQTLEELGGLGFTWSNVAQMLGFSSWTTSRRIKKYGLESLQGFSGISDQDLDSLVKELLERQGRTMGQVFMGGYLKSEGLWVQ